MSLNSGASPNVVKVDLDYVFKQEYDRETHGNFANATTEMVFKQKKATNAAVQVETFGGITYWPERAEEEDVATQSPRSANKATYTVKTFSNSVEIPKRFFDDDMHHVYEAMIADFAAKAKATRDRTAMKYYADGFATNKTADSSYIFVDDHTTISGATVDNYTTAALSPTALNAGITALAEQKDQAGVVMASIAKVLLVPVSNFKNAVELCDADRRPNTANNEPNYFSHKFNLYVATSPYLGADATGIAGADAYWYLLAGNHCMTRYERESIDTQLIPYELSKNNVYVYKGEFREVIGCQDYVGLYGSIGTT